MFGSSRLTQREQSRVAPQRFTHINDQVVEDAADPPDYRDFHTPPGTPSTPREASPRRAYAKKKDVRTKPPIPYKVVLQPGERPKREDAAGRHQRRAEKMMNNRASAAKSREKKKQIEAEKDAELESLRARAADLERRLSLLKRSSSLETGSGPKIPSLPPSESVNSDPDLATSIACHRIGVNSTFKSSENITYTHGNSGNSDSPPSDPMFDSEASVQIPASSHDVGANSNIASNDISNGNSGNLDFRNFTGLFTQARNGSIAHFGSRAQSFLRRQDPGASGQRSAAVHDPSVLFCKCAHCAARDRASRGSYQRSGAQTQRAPEYDHSTAVYRSGRRLSEVSNIAAPKPDAPSQHCREKSLPDCQRETDQGAEGKTPANICGRAIAPEQEPEHMVESDAAGCQASAERRQQLFRKLLDDKPSSHEPSHG